MTSSAPPLLPLILDAEFGGEPDAVLALMLAAIIPNLGLVLTGNDHDGHRARFARLLLDELCRPRVRVVAGSGVRADGLWTADGLVPDDVPAQSTDVVGAVAEFLNRFDGKVAWAGLGRPTNVARALSEIPSAAQRLVVTHVTSAHGFTDDWADHRVDADLPAVATLLESGADLRLVPGMVGRDPRGAVTRDHPCYEIMARRDDPVCLLVRRHMDQWFETVRPDFDVQSQMTMTLALDLAFLRTGPIGIGLTGERGGIAEGDIPATLAYRAEFDEYAAWSTPRLRTIARGSAWLPIVDPHVVDPTQPYPLRMEMFQFADRPREGDAGSSGAASRP
jgi:hypothetical protein